MSKPVVFMFPGQGSQYYQMGKELFQTDPTFRKWMLRLDGIIKQKASISPVDYLYDGKRTKSDVFDRQRYTGPAIFLIEYALAQVLLAKGIEPDYVLGASLGEYTAAALAGVLPYEEIIEIVLQMAQIVEAHCPRGGMLAILAACELYHNTPVIHRNSELASVNFHSHFVVSGARDNLQLIQDHLRQRDICYQLLPIPYAFHSSFLEPCAPLFADLLKARSFQTPRIPFISCCRAGIVEKIGDDHLWEVVRKPILFQETIGELEKKEGCLYLDLGPSGTLATFVKYNLASDSPSESFALLTPFGQDLRNLERIGRQ